MKSKTKTLAIVLAFVFCLCLPLQAEVSLQGDGSKIFVRADGGQVWKQHRPGVDQSLLLNPMGDVRGDRFGAWSTNPITGLAEVVWSKNTGGQFEVVFSWFENGAWQGPLNLSQSIANDLTPVLYHDHNGARYVLWTSYEEERSAARISVSQAGTPAFGRPIDMGGDEVFSRYPSGLVTSESLITVHEEVRGDDRVLRVLEYILLNPFIRSTPMENPFERAEIPMEDDGEDGLDKGPDSIQSAGWGVTITPGIRPDLNPARDAVPSDPQIHLEQGVAWVDWLQSETRAGFSAHDGNAFGEPRFLTLRGAGDLDAARQKIRATILGRRTVNR